MTNFNYWMIVVPILFLLGMVLGYRLVLPGKRRPLRRPFRLNRSDTIVVMLVYSSLTGAIAMSLLLIESRLGIIELFGRDRSSSIVLMFVAVFLCGIVTIFVTYCGMAAAYNHHVKQLKRDWLARRARQAVDIDRQEAALEGAFRRTLDAQTIDPAILSREANRRRRSQLRRKWAEAKSWATRLAQTVRVKRSLAFLPEDTVRRYHGGHI